MISTIGKKLFFLTAALQVLVLAATLGFLERSQARQWEEHLHTQSLAFARLATPELLRFFRGTFPPSQQPPPRELRELLSFNQDLMQFSLYAPSGRLLYASPLLGEAAVVAVGDLLEADPGSLRVQQPQTSLERRQLGGEHFLDLIHPAFGPTGEHVLSVRYLISSAGIRELQAATRADYLRIALIAALTSLVLAALMARWVSRPVRQLTSGARALARGETPQHLHLRGRDEIGALARAFNDMASSLAAKHGELLEKNTALAAANQDLRQMQDSLVRAEKLAAIGQLAAGVSHEIDNPVGIILGYAELLRDEFPDGDARREDVETIIRECQRCRRITGGLLGFARQQPTHCEPLDLNTLAADILRSLQVQKLFRDIRWVTSFAPAPVIVAGDSDKLRQVLINLLLNAGQALNGHGEICLEIRRVDGCAEILVADSGPGIAEADLEKVFEPFYSTKERGQGTGLGLAVCRKLVDEHGGRVSAARRANGGAQFRVLLPLAQEEKCFDISPDNSLG
ncbi:His Kinase A (phospho-acceptor) domain-containing protein [Geoalkalibacter ferrihydriticus]|uniref:histidine kinase n=1 Tax=Geoalkalibacter ferrihydriticus TaxID=392333 RepID=A0A1G9JQG2_9BACT|nr:ATP-binding protein [Geoalkalibacter ferrihydriticus]SDL39777.1 His Kinase A (phospho-acceptor) domain-containing protein [Geoalkalibacter ferrihydriticus]